MNAFLKNVCRPIMVTSLVASTLLASFSALGTPANAQRSGIPTTKMILPALYAQSVFLKFVLGAYGKSDQEKIRAVKDAEAAIEQFAFQTRSMHQVSDLKELEEMRALHFPRFYTLKDELDYRRSAKPPGFFVIVPGSGEVEDALEALWNRQEKRLEAFAHLNSALNKPVSNVTVNSMILSILNNPGNVKLGLGLADDRARLAVAELMHSEIRKGITQIDSTGRLIAESGSIQHPDPSMQRFFQLAIGEYFRGLETGEKLNIIADFIDNPDLSAPSEKFEMMVMNSGPQFQKLFQVYAREEGFSPEMKAIFKRLESSVRPAPWRLVEPMIMAEQVPFRWVEISPEPMGVGTMAQVHRAKIRLASGEVRSVVVRVMKPGIEKRLKADNLVLQRLAPVVDADPTLRSLNFPQITPFVNEIIEMGMNELNVPATVVAQKKGALHYEREVELGNGSNKQTIAFHVPKIYDLDPKSTMMVQEFVPGRSFEAFAKETPSLARFAVEELAKLWIETALVGDGFYHSDLHQGNIRIGAQPRDKIQVNLLDFGMSGQLDSQMQNRIIALAAIIGTNRADLIAKAMWEISVVGENKITLPELRALVARELARVANTSSAIPNDFGMWVAMAANEGIKFPAELSSLNRGMTLMSQMLRSQKSSMQASDVIKRAIARNPMILRKAMKSMQSITTREWMGVIWSSVSGRTAEASSCQVVFAQAK